jgi:NAD(P)-dependent dehydrogenase (short-subunit alcohol dehydrogenase family)
MAQRFVVEGAYVFITGRRQSELDTAVKQIGKNVTGVQGDVPNLADLDRLYTTVKQQEGRIDILFANAGLLGNASYALPVVITKTLENQKAFIPKSHVGLFSGGMLNSWRNPAPQHT